jgi:hypothetical protein
MITFYEFLLILASIAFQENLLNPCFGFRSRGGLCFRYCPQASLHRRQQACRLSRRLYVFAREWLAITSIEVAAVLKVLALAEGSLGEAEFAAWLKESAVKA